MLSGQASQSQGGAGPGGVMGCGMCVCLAGDTWIRGSDHYASSVETPGWHTPVIPTWGGGCWRIRRSRSSSTTVDLRLA